MLRRALTAAALVVAAAPATALAAQPGRTATFTNTSAPTFATARTAQPIQVNGLAGRITDVDVFVNGLTHAPLRDVRLVLVSPAGTATVLLAGNCDVDTQVSLRVDSQSSVDRNTVAACPDGTARPSNNAPAGDGSFDGVPGGPTRTADLDVFDGQAASGTWRLFVYGTGGGRIAGAFGLDITTGPSAVEIPAIGPASTYPITTTFPDDGTIVTAARVDLIGVHHGTPDDLEVLLRGPDGRVAQVLSDACGTAPIDAFSWTFEDAAAGPLGDEGGCTAPFVRPSAYAPEGDVLPAPAPAGPPRPGGLADVALQARGGDWSLFIADDRAGDEGFLTSLPRVRLTTRAPAPTRWQAGVQAPEGGVAQLLLERTEVPVGAGEVRVVVEPSAGTARAGGPTPIFEERFELPLGRQVTTIEVPIPDDATPEGEQRFTVRVASAGGDARPDATTTITVPANDMPPVDPGPGTPPADGGGAPGGAAAGGPSGVGGSAGAGGGATPARPRTGFGARAAVTLRAVSTRVRRDGRLRVVVANAEPFAITGRLRATAPGGRPTQRTLRLAAERRATVALTLPRSAHDALRRRGRLAVALRATLRDPRGASRTVVRRVVLRPRR